MKKAAENFSRIHYDESFMIWEPVSCFGNSLANRLNPGCRLVTTECPRAKLQQKLRKLIGPSR